MHIIKKGQILYNDHVHFSIFQNKLCYSVSHTSAQQDFLVVLFFLLEMFASVRLFGAWN